MKKKNIPLGYGIMIAPEIECFDLFQEIRKVGLNYSDPKKLYCMDYRSAKLQSILIDGLQGKPSFHYIREASKLSDKFEQRRKSAIKQIESLGLDEINESKVFNVALNLLKKLEFVTDDNLRKQQQYQDLFLDATIEKDKNKRRTLKPDEKERYMKIIDDVCNGETIYKATLEAKFSKKQGFINFRKTHKVEIFDYIKKKNLPNEKDVIYKLFDKIE